MRYLTAILLLALTVNVPSAEAPTLFANGAPVRTTLATDDTYDDLAPLLASVGEARIVRLIIDTEGVEGLDGAPHDAANRIIRALHEQAGYDVLVLPAGIYEAAWVDEALATDASPAEAAKPLYRVWREDESFLRILEYVDATRDDDERLELIGGLCRYHATGKELYGTHLVAFFDAADPDLLTDDLRERIARHWAGRERLARASAEQRQAAGALAEALIARFDANREPLVAHYGERRVVLERQFLRNMQRFVELETIRGGDREDDGSFAKKEKGGNLKWFLKRGYPEAKLIYWEGRGSDTDALPTGAEVATVRLTPARS